MRWHGTNYDKEKCQRGGASRASRHDLPRRYGRCGLAGPCGDKDLPTGSAINVTENAAPSRSAASVTAPTSAPAASPQTTAAPGAHFTRSCDGTISSFNTVMKKAIAHPTDARLYEKARRRLVTLAQEADRLEREQGDHARKVWRDWGRAAFEVEAALLDRSLRQKPKDKGKLYLKRDNRNGTFTIVEAGSPQAVATRLGLGALAYAAVGDWSVEVDANGALQFLHAGVARMRLDPDGKLTLAGYITAFGAP